MSTRKEKIEKAQAIIRGGSGEPVIAQDNYRESFIRAFNWYNSNEDFKVIRKWAETYANHTKRKDCVYAIGKAWDHEIKQIGIVGRLIGRGQYVSEEHISQVESRLEELKAKYKKEKVVDATAPTQPVLSIQERILESARKYSGDFYDAIDSFATTKSSNFSAKSYLLTNEISGPVAKRISEFFRPLARELEEAIAGKDEQLNEGYSHFSKRELKAYFNFVQQIVNDCDQQVVTSKTARKPRARKEKPASVLVAKLQYMKEFADLKLKSVDPQQIVGASELWAYNTKTRKLIVFKAADGTLSVKGATIMNYDVAESGIKAIRKPEEFFKGLSSTGKRAMANAWKAIRGKVSPVRSRLNADTIILAVN